MALDLRANTAVDVLIGPFVDSTDGNTEETGLTISQADVLLSKNGQALTQKNDANAAAHDANGYYNCPLNATDTNTEGNLVLIVHEAGSLPVRHEFNVMAEAAWDSLYVAKDDGFMDVNIKTVGRTDTQETEANNLEAACAAYSAERGLTGTALPAAAADAAGGLPLSDAGGLDLDTLLARLDAAISTRSTYAGADTAGTTTLLSRIVGTLLAGNHSPQSGDAFARLGAAGAGLTALGDERLQELAAPNLPADIDTLIARLTAERAAYLDAAISSRLAPTGTLARVTLTDTVTTYTGNTPQTADGATAFTRVLLALPAFAPDAAGGLPTTTKITDARLGVLTDWIDGGRLDLILDARAPAATALSNTLWTDAKAGFIDVSISSRGTGIAMDAAGVRAALGLNLANLDTQLADKPSIAAVEARTLLAASYATAANQTTLLTRASEARLAKLDVTGTLATHTAADVKIAIEATGSYLALVKDVTDKMVTGLELDDAVYRWTANALELAPGGAGGGSATIENQELILSDIDLIKKIGGGGR